jgi:TonB family protein
MIRTCLLIASGILVACTCFFAQNPSSAADSTSVTNPAAGDSGVEHGINVSGFEILNGGRNPNDLVQYPNLILAKVRSKWDPQIQELQKSIARKRGVTIIDLEISNDGSLGKVTTVESAGDASLDAAASLAIRRSVPFPRLPEAYHKKALKIRMHFGYDQPASAEAPACDGPNWGAHPAAYVLHQSGDGVTPPQPTYSPDPEYSEEGRRDKYMSIVRIAGTVDPQGSFTDLCVTQAGGAGLDEKAMEAVKTWKFEPATLQGEPVAVRVNVEVSFRLY